MSRLPVLSLSLALLAGSCGGGGAEAPSGDNGGRGGEISVGPPLPELIDESGAPAMSSASRIAFTGVSVRTLGPAGRLDATTVVVENGRIAGIVPDAQFGAAPGTEIIDAAGRWLMPGLVDSHVHMVPSGEDDLLLYLAAGVTAVRVMWGNEIYLRWRDEIAAGTRQGPYMWVASPGLDGANAFWPGSVIVTSEVEARTAVDEMAAAGFDAIKVYNGLQPSQYVAIANEAESIGIPFVGHVTGSDWNFPLDEQKVADLAERLFTAGIWNVPTFVVQLRISDQVGELEAHPVMSWISPGMGDFLRDASTQPPAGPQPDPTTRFALLKLLHESGVRLAVGTDVGIRYVFPGFSLQEELQNFVRAGLSPEAAIHAATVSAWDLLGAADEGGTVEVGKRADLLLAADPFADVDNLLRRVGVMANGRWYSQSHLLSLVEE